MSKHRDSIISIDVCPCTGKGQKSKDKSIVCCVVCPICQKNIRLNFLFQHIRQHSHKYQ